MYDSSRRTGEQVHLDYFRTRYQTLEETKNAFLNIVDEIHSVEFDINPEYVPSYQILDTLDELYCTPPTGENYRIIYQALVDKFSDKRAMANSYLDQIINFKQAPSETASNLNAFLEKFNVAVNSLQKLAITNLDDYILAYLALSKLNPETQRSEVQGIGATGSKIYGCTNIVITSQIDASKRYPLEVLVVEKITNKLPQVEINVRGLSHLTNIPLADNSFHQPNKIDGIIGADLYPYLIGQGRVIGPPKAPVALETQLGYVVMGSVSLPVVENTFHSFCSIVDPSIETLVKRFWEIEEIQCSPVMHPDDLESAEIVKGHMYMDDLVSSICTVDQALHLYDELIELFSRGGFELVKWATNCPELLKHIPEQCQSSSLVNFDVDFLKVLGLQWCPKSDLLCFALKLDKRNCSKRNVLSTLARCFDPLGFLSPVTLQAKLVIKNMWILKLDWDDTPPTDMIQWWNDFQHALPLLSQFNVPRHIGAVCNSSAMLIGFADACQTSYGAVVYMRIDSPSGIYTSLLYAKTKVSPTKVLQRWNNLTTPIKCGTIVILESPNTPPLHWPLGIITEAFSGKDGQVRVVSVKTKTGIYKRPVVKVCPLPTQ
ncbi:hypothetical protein NQ317_017008 [Molorchus minor]|uniref:DUF5641 domain-containing protein n=1 Tax=Molorchus minor TaxID=1323400 RepID=A0ABQ9IUW8_9CUCU|nr:hypothetical protein NQ317_017008 [Molorchus minor]